MRRLIVSGAIIATMLAGIGVAMVSAAPINAKSSFEFQGTCDNGQSYDLVVNGNGTFTPGHVLSGNGENAIPVALDLTATDANGNVIFSEQATKSGLMKGRQTVNCDVNAEIPGVGTFSGTATVVFVPVSH
jgi:hypothetical protein